MTMITTRKDWANSRAVSMELAAEIRASLPLGTKAEEYERLDALEESYNETLPQEPVRGLNNQPVFGHCWAA